MCYCPKRKKLSNISPWSGRKNTHLLKKKVYSYTIIDPDLDLKRNNFQKVTPEKWPPVLRWHSQSSVFNSPVVSLPARSEASRLNTKPWVWSCDCFQTPSLSLPRSTLTFAPVFFSCIPSSFMNVPSWGLAPSHVTASPGYKIVFQLRSLDATHTSPSCVQLIYSNFWTNSQCVSSAITHQVFKIHAPRKGIFCY